MSDSYNADGHKRMMIEPIYVACGALHIFFTLVHPGGEVRGEVHSTQV